MSGELKNIVEAVLMVSDTPLSVAKILAAFDDKSAPTTEQVEAALAELQEDCARRAIDLKKIGKGYRFQTKLKYAGWIRKLQAGRPPKLPRALLETLAIIAYRQPVSRGDIEDIRGVSVSTEIMQRLMEREWVNQVGVRDTPGRPALFGTTPAFLSYFNLESLSELPLLMEQRELGVIASEMDTPLPPEVLAALDGEQPGEQKQPDVFQLNLAVGQQNHSEDEAEHDRELTPDSQLNDQTSAEAEVAEPDATI
ncbi:SMC-Scp complex subunit ScpB [Candidatus Spongiihabitans sp.]|uniref:SMC-Scp complex subunit ScpB n=1 Tax=Candidatus Spongiihabitans sp. TaxID=3101308 RepID=UPI003C7D95EA